MNAIKLKKLFWVFFCILFTAIGYSQETNLTKDQRFRAYFQLEEKLYSKELTVEEKLIVMDQLIVALEDPVNSNRLAYSHRMLHYPSDYFSTTSQKFISRVLNTDTLANFYTILLAGHLNLQGQKKVIRQYIKEERTAIIGYRSKKWAAHLALAKMGEEEHIDFILATVKKEKYEQTVFFDLLPHLGYVGVKQTIDVIIDKLFSDVTISYAAYEEEIKNERLTLAQHALSILAVLIKDFPIEKSRTYNRNDLELVKNWFIERNRKYEIKEGAIIGPG